MVKINIHGYPLSPILLFTHSWLIMNIVACTILATLSFITYLWITPPSPLDITAATTTMDIRCRSTLKLLRQTPSVWKIKLAIFYVITFLQFVSASLISWAHDEIRIVSWAAFDPNTMILANILYYISVTSGVIQSLSSAVSFRHTITPHHATLPAKLQREYINRKDMPLPYICMVLSNVMLHMHFVGQAIKYGAQWMPFTKYLHNIGMNGMVNAQASHTKSKQIDARRISTLLGILTASTCMLSAQALNISTNLAFVFQHNATFRIHDADNPKPLRQGSYIDTNMRSISSTPINHIPDNTELCMVATKLALQSKVDWEQSRNTFNFIPTNTEFGTDNCATQHICGLEDLFIHMREPASPIGVKGISGVSTAKGIGSIRFTLKDDQQTTRHLSPRRR